MGFFPLYRENLLTGPSHVSFSLPGIPSGISKSIGLTSSALLLIPNIDFLKKFIEGDLGISDSTWKSSLLKNINSSVSSSQEMVFRKFSEVNELGLTDISKYKKDGKFKLPLSEVKISSVFDGGGLKAFEKATLQSIFETQKPYMEIAKTVLSLLVDIEDIVARVMPLASVNPLKHKSEKPTVNNGGSGAKAVGYQSGKDIKVILAQLGKVSKQGGKITVNKDGSVTKESQNKKVNDSESELDPDTISANDKLVELSKTYKIVNVVYSTNYYDPKIDYLYSYIDLPSDPEAPVNDTPEDDDTDPYNKYKPKKIVFGIFNSKGVPVNPDEFLKTIGYSGNQITQVSTSFKRAEWLKKSSKWRFRGNEYVWPTFGTPNFVFSNGLIDQVAKTAPSTGNLVPSYSLKKYKEGDKNILNNQDANPGDPVINGFDSTDTSIYTNYFTEYTTINLRLAKDLEEKDRIEATQTIMSQLDVNSHLESVFNYGQNKSSVYKNINGNLSFPEVMKLSFKPYQIFVAEAQADEKLAGLNGLIWIDPESDYDMKVIRIDPVTKIKSVNAKNEPDLVTTIKSFIKNKYTIKLSNNSKFNIDIKRNGLKYDSQKDVTTYTLENWNYENSKIENTNIFSYTVYNDTISLTGDLSIDNLPVIGKEKIVNIDINNNIGLESNIPLYQLRVTDLNNPYGSIIDPSKITNENLSKDELFSKGKYGVGDSDNPQEIEILERYQMTDLDTESYYIIEGIRVDQNIQDGDSGSKWYRLPHAVGAVTVFIKMLIKVFAKLIPSITKLLKLFSNPMSFITDIIAEKLGDSFTFLSQAAFKKFDSVNELSKKRDVILSKEGGSVYVNKIKEQFKDSPLKNYMFVNNFGTKATNMPGIKNITDKVTSIGSLTSGLDGLKSVGSNIVNNLTSETSTISNGLTNQAKSFTNNLNKNKLIPPILKEVQGMGDFKCILDGVGFIPFSIFGKDLSFGMELKFSNLMDKKPPLKLLFNESKKSKDINGQNNKNNNITSGDKSNLKLTDPNQFASGNVSGGTQVNTNTTGKNTNQEDVYISTTWYSTGEFINGVDYNYIYITQDNEQLLKEVRELENSDNPSDVLLAKEKLEGAIKNNPNDESLKDKLKEIKSKLFDLASNTQPILKLILSLVTLPIKVIADIIKYIMDFFKSLTNPLTLPIKIAEFLSFKWIMDFFTPKGILDILGVKFKPELIGEWVSMATMTGQPSILEKSKNKSKKIGFLYDDDFELADLSKFFSAPFISPLPTYTASHFRDMIKNKSLFPFKLFFPTLCFIEKNVNGFIDFVWSTLGIEILIKPPHIKLCSTSDPENASPLELLKTLNGETSTSNSDNNTTEINSTEPFQSQVASDSFLYEVKLPDGTIETFLDRDGLDKFMSENKDINFDLEF